MSAAYVYCNTLPLLLFSSVTDIREQEIPLWACAASCVAAAGFQLWDGLGWAHVGTSALSGLLPAAIFLINTLFLGGGGGDCTLSFAIGISLGATAGLVIILIACLLVTAFCLISKKRTPCPLAPFLFTGTIVYLILGEIL